MNLPKDMQVLILDQLSDQDLYHYGTTCKSARTYSELIWKKRWKAKCDVDKKKQNGQEVNVCRNMSWFYNYITYFRDSFTQNIENYLNQINSIPCYTQKREKFEQMLEYIFSQKNSVFGIRKFSFLRKIILEKLIQFKKENYYDTEMIQICDYYAKELFDQNI